jgi:protein subunit release factor A
MRLNIDRLCELAGVREGSGSLLSESSESAAYEAEEVEESLDEAEEVEESLDEAEEVEESLDEAEETRSLQEAHLKATIKKEIQNILREMEEDDSDMSGRWVYGKNQPKASRRGLVATSFPGIGFRN